MPPRNTVFISYARSDGEPFAYELSQLLQTQLGISVWQDRIRNIPMKRPETPEDLTGMAVFLASADADYITGQSYHVDGGLVMS